MMAALTLLAAALVFVVIEMTATWLVARKLRNNGIVDIVWSAGFAPLALLYFFLCSAGQREFDTYPRWIAITTMVVVWGLRLGSHLLVRVCAHHPHEDVRYAKLREEWGTKVDARMFGFFQLQGLLQVLLSLPVMVVRLDENRYADGVGLGLTGLLGVALWATGLLGESLADRQLARFRADPANKGKVCQAGLWNYSRHPNYFFEWLVWVGYAVFALGSPWGWLGLIAPALMLHFLLNVTGIPMTEELSLKSKGDAYREYQRTTSAFVPWFKKAKPLELRGDFLTKLKESAFQPFISNNRVAVVLFDAEWDGACRALILNRLKSACEQYADSVAFGEVDVDVDQELSRKLEINQVPTLVYFRNGEVLASVVNATQDVTAELAKILGSNPPSKSPCKTDD